MGSSIRVYHVEMDTTSTERFVIYVARLVEGVE